MAETTYANHIPPALPFWVSLTLVPVAWIGAIYGGWTLALLPIYAWGAFSVLDKAIGIDPRNPDIETPETDIRWHQLITTIWPFVQFATTFGLLAYATSADHLSSTERVALFFGVGLMNGTIGLVYAHELIHRSSRLGRFLGDMQLAMVLYGHYRSEHLLVHHRYVATPRDPVSARFREHFWKFYPRVLVQSLLSSFNAEKAILARRERPVWHWSNPFWRYVSGAVAFLLPCLRNRRPKWRHSFHDLRRFRDFPARVGELHRTLWPDPQTSWRWALRVAKTASQLEFGPCRNVGPTDQRHATFRSPHQPGSALCLAANPTRKRRPAPASRVRRDDDNGADPAALDAHHEPARRAWRRQFYPDITDWSAYDQAKNPPPS